MSKYTEAQNKASQRYQKKAYDSTLIRFKKTEPPTLDDVRAAADAAGLPLQGFIIEAITEKIARQASQNAAGEVAGDPPQLLPEEAPQAPQRAPESAGEAAAGSADFSGNAYRKTDTPK